MTVDEAIAHWTKVAAERGIEVPKWVPKPLIVEFCDCAVTHGEECAASFIRKRKAEMRL